MTRQTQRVRSLTDSYVDVPARDRVGGVGLLLVAATLVTASPTIPVGSLFVLSLAVVVRPSPAAFVIGQLTLIPSLTATSPLAGVAQLGLLAVLTEPARNPFDLFALSATVTSFGGLLGLIVLARGEALLVVGGLFCLAVSASLYGIYRGTLVRLGLVRPPDTPTEKLEPKSQE